MAPVKYDFDTPFGEEGRQRAEEQRRAIEQAREEGRRQGVEEGREQARKELEAQIQQTLQTVVEKCDALAGQQAELETRMEGEMAQIAYAIGGKLAPALIQRHSLPEIEALVADCLDGCRREARIVVRVCDELVEPLKERLEALKAASSFSGQIVLLGEPDLAAGDCRVEWPDGGAERDMDKLKTQIGEAIERFAATVDEPATRDALADQLSARQTAAATID